MTATARPLLRPLRMGEILDRAIHLYRRHFLHFVGVVALVQVPLVLAQMSVSVLAFGGTLARMDEMLSNPAAVPESPLAVFGPSYLAGASLNTLVSILGFILVQGVATAALTAAVTRSYLGAPAPNIVDAYRAIKDRWVAVVGALLLAVLLGLALAAWWILVPCVGWLTGGGMLLFLWQVIVPLLAPIVILEEISPASAWRRAWSLTRRRFWWVLGFALLLYLFNLLVVAGPAAVVTAAGQFAFGQPFDFDQGTFTIQTVVQSLTTLITSLLYLPLQVAAMTLLYIDLRVRTEGLDLAILTRQVQPQVEPVAAVSQLPTASGEPALITGKEWRNFAVITVGVIVTITVLYLLLVGLVVALLAAFGAGV